MTSSKSTPDLIFGAGGIGDTGEGWFTYTWSTEEQVSSLLDTLTKNKISLLDSAASYPPGNPWDTNRLLGLSKAAAKGFQIDTKISIPPSRTGALTRSNIDFSIQKDLGLLGIDKVRILYAHAPDPATTLQETAAAFDEQFRKGRCEMLGLCNYPPAMLQEYLDICEKNGYQKPHILQDQYSAIYRFPENDLLKICREHSIKFYAYSPLAGGFLTGKTTRARLDAAANQNSTHPTLERTRWAADSKMRQYIDQFDVPNVHKAMQKFMDVCAAQNPPITPAAASLRWLAYHSDLGAGDGYIVGASKINQFQDSVDAIGLGPLSPELKSAIEALWEYSKEYVDESLAFGKQTVAKK